MPVFYSVIQTHKNFKTNIMKTKLIIAAIAMLTVLGTQVKAQKVDEANIKVLPSKSGILKVHYAMAVTDAITVKFFNSGGLISTDKIQGSYANGLMKRYDIKNINNSDYRVEISSPQLSVTYHVVPSKDKQTFSAFLEKSTYNYPVVASNN
jgi:hypothetical protein